MATKTQVEEDVSSTAIEILKLLEMPNSCSQNESAMEDLLELSFIEPIVWESPLSPQKVSDTTKFDGKMTSTPHAKKRLLDDTAEEGSISFSSQADSNLQSHSRTSRPSESVTSASVQERMGDTLPTVSSSELSECETTASSPSLHIKVNKHAVNSSGELKCPHCDLHISARKSNLVRHMQLHGRAPHQCRLCPKTFYRKNEIQEHMSVVHGGQRYTCELCDKEYQTKKALKLHMDGHNNVYKYVCDQCGQGFQYISNFQAHVNRHLGQKPFSCTSCAYSTAAKSDLLKHQISCQTKRKEYECNVCHNLYKTRKSLKAHKKAHTNPHSFVCCTCGKGYPFRSSLYNHEKKCGTLSPP